MWIFLNDAFFSIVEDDKPGRLLVRSRFSSDITNVFPEAKVRRTPDRDYLYRTSLPRKEVEDAIANEVSRINYSNFKDSVEDDKRHTLYERVWSVMFNAQEVTRKTVPVKKQKKQTSPDFWVKYSRWN